MSRRRAVAGRATWAAVAPPVVAYALSTLLSWAIAALCGERFWSVAGRWRWDSEHYLSIADGGYEMFRCQDRYSNFPDVWCGNAAWFPGYPYATRVVSWTGLPTDVAAVVVTEVSLLGVFALLWWLVRGFEARKLAPQPTVRARLVLLAATVFPGGIYLHAIFPIAFGTFALLLCVAGVKREWWWLAGLGGFLATASHLVGAVSVVMLVLSVLFGWRSTPWRMRVVKGFAAAAMAAGGYGLMLWLEWRATGRWNAYALHNAEAYGQSGLRNPFKELERFWDVPFTEWHPLAAGASWLERHSTEAHHAQLVLNIVLVVGLVALQAWLLRHDGVEPWEWAVFLLALGVFAVPLLGGAAMSWYRNDAMMLVALPLLRRATPWVVVPVIGVMAAQYAALSAMWYAGSLI